MEGPAISFDLLLVGLGPKALVLGCPRGRSDAMKILTEFTDKQLSGREEMRSIARARVVRECSGTRASLRRNRAFSATLECGNSGSPAGNAPRTRIRMCAQCSE